MITKIVKKTFDVTFNDVGKEKATNLEEVGLRLGVKPTINPRTPEPPINIIEKLPTKKSSSPTTSIKKTGKKIGK